MAEIRGEFGARLAVVENEVERMQHALFGNGQPGILATLQKTLEDVKADNRRLAYLLIAAVALMLFAAGSGTVSLKSVIDLIGKI